MSDDQDWKTAKPMFIAIFLYCVAMLVLHYAGFF